MNRPRVFSCLAPLARLCGVSGLVVALLLVAWAAAGESTTAKTSPQAMLGQLPFYFESNRGQFGEAFPFVARGQACQFFVGPAEAVLVLARSQSAPSSEDRIPRVPSADRRTTRQVRLVFSGASPCAVVSGDHPLPGRANYLLGNDPGGWRTGVPLFAKARVRELYPGIDLVYYGSHQRLEYDFEVAPHADPAVIRIQFSGPDDIRVDAQGDLLFRLGGETLCQPRPVLYQTIAGVRRQIVGSYWLEGDTVTFVIGEYDRARPLVIDPVLSYSSYFGGSGSDIARAVAVDGQGRICIAGETRSTVLPVTPGAFQTNYGGGTTYNGDAFVAKFEADLTNLVYFTYLGGKTADAALALALDGAGNVHLTGYTDSTDFPLASAIQTNLSGVPSGTTGIRPIDAFVATLDARGSNLLFSTYYGGSGLDEGIGIALDAGTNLFVAGYTESTNFPTVNAWQTNYGKLGDGFVARINADHSLAYATFLGGAKQDAANDVAADAAGNAYVTGYTGSTNFAVTAGAAQTNLNNVAGVSQASDVFVTKISPAGDALLYSTFLGGAKNDFGFRLGVDGAGCVYVTGSTFSGDFPRSVTNIPSGVAAGYTTEDVFVTKLNADGSARLYSLMFGGTGTDRGWDVAVDAAGGARVVGSTASVNFPTRNTSGSLRNSNAGGTDAFVVEVNSGGTELLWSAYLGGGGTDLAYGVALGHAGEMFVVGETASGNFPTVVARQTTFAGTKDAFIARISSNPSLFISEAGNDVVLAWSALAEGFRLQSNTNLTNAAGWLLVPQSPVLANGWFTVTLGATNSARFFRLREP